MFNFNICIYLFVQTLYAETFSFLASRFSANQFKIMSINFKTPLSEIICVIKYIILSKKVYYIVIRIKKLIKPLMEFLSSFISFTCPFPPILLNLY